MVDLIFFGKKKNSNESIVHGGDNYDGKGKGDDEVIKVDLKNIPARVDSIWPCITIFKNNKTFQDVTTAYCRIYTKD